MTRATIAWTATFVLFALLYFVWREVAQQVLPRRPVPLQLFFNMAFFLLLMVWLARIRSFWIAIPASTLLLPFFVFTRIGHAAQDIAAVAGDYLEPLVISLLSGAWAPALISSFFYKWLMTRRTDAESKH